MRRLGSVPRAVWLIVGLHGALLALYSVSFAPFRGPDEPQHTDLARYVAWQRDHPRYDVRNLGAQIFNAYELVRFDVPAVRSRDLPEGETWRRSDRPGFVELAGDLDYI